jgi:DNA-binding NarL/FixJ family response regulator
MPNSNRLTSTQIDVLRKLCSGLSKQQIADSRQCSLHTIQTHVWSLRDRFASDTERWTDEQLIDYAREHVLPQYPDENVGTNLPAR